MVPVGSQDMLGMERIDNLCTYRGILGGKGTKDVSGSSEFAICMVADFSRLDLN
jgi:hypothetical protein